jgi:dihydroxyacetone kinase-like predicted kinase
VLILPNNRNIVPVAEQVAGLTAKEVRVLPTKGVTEGLAAAMQYDPEGSVDDNLHAMRRAADAVVSGEITRAVRDSVCDAGPIAAGDHLGITRDGIEVVEARLSDAVTALLAKLVTDDHEIVTLIEGDGSAQSDTRRIAEWLADHRPGVALEVHHGGQPLYPYLLGVE